VSKRKKKVSAAKRTAKRSRVHVDDSDKELNKASEPEEGKSSVQSFDTVDLAT